VEGFNACQHINGAFEDLILFSCDYDIAPLNCLITVNDFTFLHLKQAAQPSSQGHIFACHRFYFFAPNTFMFKNSKLVVYNKMTNFTK
jgi:hypothetical protein